MNLLHNTKLLTYLLTITGFLILIYKFLLLSTIVGRVLSVIGFMLLLTLSYNIRNFSMKALIIDLIFLFAYIILEFIKKNLNIYFLFNSNEYIYMFMIYIGVNVLFTYLKIFDK